MSRSMRFQARRFAAVPTTRSLRLRPNEERTASAGRSGLSRPKSSPLYVTSNVCSGMRKSCAPQRAP